MSGQHEATMGVAALNATLLAKPISPDELVAAIRAATAFEPPLGP
jgi:hypothetical protein